MLFVLSVLLVIPNALAINVYRVSSPHEGNQLYYDGEIRVKRENCGPGQWQCTNGACIESKRRCDNVLDCSDESDEKLCDTQKPLFICRDGSSVTTDKQCDGTKDCPDGTDEDHAICKHIICPDYLFRCTYGACVDGTALCNNVTDCADNSDELHPKCRKESDIIGYKFKCQDGQLIDVYFACDGVKHCQDGSDETLRACAGASCNTNLFQCAYGACVDEGADCNNIEECVDGSDESDILCNRTRITTTTSTTTPSTIDVSDADRPMKCEMPHHIPNGMLNLERDSDPKNDYIVYTVTCRPGYKLIGVATVVCFAGVSDDIPTCNRSCKLEPSESVQYRCIVSDNAADTTRLCEDEETEYVLVQPECRRPNYYSDRAQLEYMVCNDGRWSNQPKCHPECGTLTPKGEALIANGGTAVELGDIPWHAGIFWKNYTTVNNKDVIIRTQICGGSLISESIVLSAAHCFWDDKYHQLPDINYAVAVGKLYRAWKSSIDKPYAEYSDVKKIIIHQRFLGRDFNFQYDIAVVIVKDPFVYRPYIRPVCLDFETVEELINGTTGKVAGWGLTSGYQNSESPYLKVLDVPFVPFTDCVHASKEKQYKEYLVADKICAGYGNGTSLCKGDSGGGLAFPFTRNGVSRYYLRGIVSTSPPSEDGKLCNTIALTSFTDLVKHAELVTKYWYN